MKNLEVFKDTVKEYTRQTQRKLDGKLATMGDLAVSIGFTREALSKKLNGKSPMDARDVRNIVRGLARLDAITSRNQAKYLLNLMDVPNFEEVDWDAEPLNKLISKSQTDELTIDPPKVEVPTELSMASAATAIPQKHEVEVSTKLSVASAATAIPQKHEVEVPTKLSVVSAATAIPPKYVRSPTSSFRLQRKWLIALFLLIFISNIAFYVLPRYHFTLSPGNVCPPPSSTDSVKDIYTFATCKGRLVMADSLQAQSSYDWDQNERCFFLAGAYHVIVPETDFVSECFAQKLPMFSDFAMQVDMTILQGGSGGLLFRAEDTNARDTNAVVYRVPMDDNGSYNFYLGKDLPCSNIPVGENWCRSSQNIFHRTLGEKNTLTIVALGNTIYLYVNGQFVDSARNTYSASGHIGVFANAYHNNVEVMFNALKIWTW